MFLTPRFMWQQGRWVIFRSRFFLWPAFLAFPLQLLVEGVHEMVGGIGLSLYLLFPPTAAAKPGLGVDLLPVSFGFLAAVLGWLCIEMGRKKAIQTAHVFVSVLLVPVSLATFWLPYFFCGAHWLTLAKYLLRGVELLALEPMEFDLGLEGCCVGFENWEMLTRAWVFFLVFYFLAPAMKRRIERLGSRIWPASPGVKLQAPRLFSMVPEMAACVALSINRFTAAIATKVSLFFAYTTLPVLGSLIWGFVVVGATTQAHGVLKLKVGSATGFSAPVSAVSLFLGFLTFPAVLFWLELLKVLFILCQVRFSYGRFISGQLLASLAASSFWVIHAFQLSCDRFLIAEGSKILLWCVVFLPLCGHWWAQWRSN